MCIKIKKIPEVRLGLTPKYNFPGPEKYNKTIIFCNSHEQSSTDALQFLVIQHKFMIS